MPFLDLESWSRREHFHFFKSYGQPYFDICAPVDVTELIRRSRGTQGPPFSLATFWLSLHAANSVENLRYRLRDEGVWIHPRIGGGTTVLRDDDTFGFAYFELSESFREFVAHARPALGAERLSRKLDPKADDDALIHYSVIPWVSFTSFAHAKPLAVGGGGGDSVPKLVFGRYYEDGKRWKMPVSLSLHHALADGLHAGRFFTAFQELLDDPPLD